MLLNQTVLIKWNPKNKQYYANKGYIYTKMKDNFLVKIDDLSDSSDVLVDVKCDNPCCKNLKSIRWVDYLKSIKKHGVYYCNKCSIELIAKEKIRKTLLIKNGKSFEQWCIENNRQDILDRWDYELNDYKPDEICFSANINIWFKCSHKNHNSELKHINSITNKSLGSVNCKQCNSFAQWGIDNISEDFLNKYWDYEKNININPFKIDRSSTIKVYMKCQLNNNHKSYPVSCHNFHNNSRCPICNKSRGEINIEEFLVKNNIIYIDQKSFSNLVGLNDGLLSYDFYLPFYNVLIEYQGEQHEKPIDFESKGKQYSQERFEYQQEHDRLKREYAQKHNINLLEIWYWDYDNIEQILDNYLSDLKEAS